MPAPRRDRTSPSPNGRRRMALRTTFCSRACRRWESSRRNARARTFPALSSKRSGTAEATAPHPIRSIAGGPWDSYRIPFLFATNGRPFLRQLRTKSGIWFLDARRPENHSRPLEGWYTPEGLLDLLKQDVDEARRAAQGRADAVHRAREYQTARDPRRRAGARARQARAAGRDGDRHRARPARASASATACSRRGASGASVPRRPQRARQADRRRVQGTAAREPPDLHRHLRREGAGRHQARPGDASSTSPPSRRWSSASSVHPTRTSDVPPVDQYDCIVVDECHRGYLLDREMSDTRAPVPRRGRLHLEVPARARPLRRGEDRPDGHARAPHEGDLRRDRSSSTRTARRSSTASWSITSRRSASSRASREDGIH